MSSRILNLFQMIKAESYLIIHKKPFWFSFWVLIIFSGMSYILNVVQGIGVDVYSMNRPIDMFALTSWKENVQYFVIFFPFLVAFPVTFSSFDEENGKCSIFSMVRKSKATYYISKMFVAFCSNVFLMWIPLGLNLLWNVITFTSNGNSHEGMVNSNIYFGDSGVAFELFYKLHPFLYAIVFVLHVGVFAGVCGVFAYSVGNYIKKYKAVLALPVFILFFVSRSLDFAGVVLDDYLSYPLKRECLVPMVIIECIIMLISCFLVWNYVRKKEIL